MSGSRLHFGLMELCHQAENCYAGLGLMLETPGFSFVLSGLSKDQPTIALSDELRARALKVLQLAKRSEMGDLPAKIELSSRLPMHSGLGAGTQFATALATAIEVFRSNQSDPPLGDWNTVEDFDWLSAEWLVQASGRGLRSAIGLQGFLSGGLIWDHGCNPTSSGPRKVECSVREFPEDWRVLLLKPRIEPDVVAGKNEAAMIDSIGEKPNPRREEMLLLAKEVMNTLSTSTSVAVFGELLDQYMILAAELFEKMQGGMYRSKSVEDTVRFAKSLGLHGVGQSSWGPTVFGFVEGEDRAQSVLAESCKKTTDVVISVHKAAQHAARYRWRTAE